MIMKFKLFGFLLAIAFAGTISTYSPVSAQTMTCTFIPGSITYFENGMVCALYSCPNGETVQSCNLPPVGVE